MRAASKSQGVAKVLVRPALGFCACNLLAAVLAAQCSNPTQVPNGTYTSGDHSDTDNNALSASNFVLSGSATATLVAGNCIQLLPGFHATAGTSGTTFHAWVETVPADVSFSPLSGSGLSQPFTWTVSSPSGYSNLSDVYALFNTTSASTVNACYIRYNRASNLLYLADNSGLTWLGGFLPGSASSWAANSYCTIYGSGSSFSTSGIQLAVTVSVTFQTSFAGTKNEYLIGYDNAGLNTTWQQFGTWTVPATQTITATPSSGLSVSVDGSPCSGSCSFQWPGGSVHTISTSLSQVGTDGKTYVFSSWSDGGAISHQITVPYAPMIYSASFAAQSTQVVSAYPNDPPGYPLSCGSANCIGAGSYIYYNFLTNYMWAVSKTVYSGPSSGNVLTHALASLGLNLGLACQSSSNSTYYYNSGYPYMEADSSDPCQSSVYYYANGSTIYTDTGTHSDSANNSYGYTKASLAFVPACKIQPFAVVLDNATDYSGATGPTIWIPQGTPSTVTGWNLATDGLSATYTARHAHDVAIQLVVPYSANKVRHDVGFGTPGNSNPWLGVVVYDDTPSVQSVSPTSIAATVPTQITIRGTGFGDHPTVYIGGTAYPITGVSCNAPAQDNLTFMVTLPVSLANSSASVCVVSNGAGGQAFAGKPLGVQNPRGSPTSNTVQVQVTSPPPAITAIKATQGTLPVGTFQIGLSGVPFEIDGSNLGAGLPTLNFGTCGITNVQIASYGQNVVTGTLDTTTGVAGQCVVTLTPYQSSQASNPYTVTMVPGPPTISGGQGIWYLGRASVNDNCDPNSPVPSCYYNSARLTVTPGPGASPPSANSPASWSLTDPLTGQPPTFASKACVDQTCGQVTIAATAQPPGCASINVLVTLGGVSSAAFTVYIDWPSTASAIFWQDAAAQDPNNPLLTGFASNNTLLLLSACRVAMFNMAVHEEFPGRPAACGNGVGWTDPIPQQQWGSWLTIAEGINAGMFLDQVGHLCAPGDCIPQAQAPGNPLAAQAISWVSQFIFVGSTDTQNLGKYFTAAPNMQVLYTDHGRDELGTWKCPGQ